MHFSLRRWFILPCGLPYARGFTKLTKCFAAPALTDLANAKKTSWQPAGVSVERTVSHLSIQPVDDKTQDSFLCFHLPEAHPPVIYHIFWCGTVVTSFFFFPVIVAATPPPTSAPCCLRVFPTSSTEEGIPAETHRRAPRLHVNTQKQVANVF